MTLEELRECIKFQSFNGLTQDEFLLQHIPELQPSPRTKTELRKRVQECLDSADMLSVAFGDLESDLSNLYEDLRDK